MLRFYYSTSFAEFLEKMTNSNRIFLYLFTISAEFGYFFSDCSNSLTIWAKVSSAL